MNPCTICGERILAYPGICDPCKVERKMKFDTEWSPSYKANTARHEAMRHQAEKEAQG